MWNSCWCGCSGGAAQVGLLWFTFLHLFYLFHLFHLFHLFYLFHLFHLFHHAPTCPPLLVEGPSRALRSSTAAPQPFSFAMSCPLSPSRSAEAELVEVEPCGEEVQPLNTLVKCTAVPLHPRATCALQYLLPRLPLQYSLLASLASLLRVVPHSFQFSKDYKSGVRAQTCAFPLVPALRWQK